MNKVPNFSNVMGQFAFEIQEFDQKINELGTQRGFVIQQRFNKVLEEFDALVPEVEFSKTVVTYLTSRGGYRNKPITRTGVVYELQLREGFDGLSWSLPMVNLTKLTAWDRRHWEKEDGDFSKYNRRTMHNDRSSHIEVGDEFEIVGEVVSVGKYGLYEVKFHESD